MGLSLSPIGILLIVAYIVLLWFLTTRVPKNGVPVVKVLNRAGMKLPFYATVGAAGADIVCSTPKLVRAHAWELIDTGLFMAIPFGYEVQIRPRSGLSARYAVTVLNSPGTIDSDYRGELKVIIINHSDVDRFFEQGERIAQIVVAPVVQATFVEVDDLPSTERGEGGFGSTGTA